MFDMATVSNMNLSSPMGMPMGSLTPGSIKYEVHSPHSASPIMSTPNSNTPNSVKSHSGNNNENGSPDFGSKCKRKINFSHLGIPNKGHGHQPQTVQRRNARERNRVKQVNNGFAALKQHIPLSHRSKKMSKVETLKCAVDYIRRLKDMLDANGNLLSSPLSSSGSDSSSDQGSIVSGPTGTFSSQSDPAYHHGNNGQFHNFGQGGGTTIPGHQLSPTSSDPSSPSYASEASSYITSSNANMNYDYENYEPVSPEDEELLDAISWWQQS